MMEAKQVEGKEVPVEILASSIVSIAEGIKRVRSGRLNDRALFLLIQNSCPASYREPRPSVKTIRNVLDAMAELEATYLKKSPK